MIEADLHLHSHHSDGVHSPSEVMAMAARAGLKAAALTDHDTLDGLAEAAAAAPAGLEVIPGLELSSSWRGREIHLLAYFVDPDDQRLRDTLEPLRRERRLRGERMVERLNRLGIPVTFEEVLRIAAGGEDGAGERISIGRPHIAEAIVRHGAAADIDEAFVRYLRRGQPAYVPKATVLVPDAVRLAHDGGAALVIAHPALNLGEADTEAVASAGLDGIEVWHPKHAEDQRRRLAALAGRLGLVATGGSDFHGGGRNRHQAAEAGVPMAAVAALRDRAGRRRGAS